MFNGITLEITSTKRMLRVIEFNDKPTNASAQIGNNASNNYPRL